jgi:hypothetical protein
MLATWSETTPLVERFGSVRQFLKQCCPHWKLGQSYSGWVAALQREHARLVPLVTERLRTTMRQLADHQRCERWEVYAVDGSELACSRTGANQAAMGDSGKPNGIPQVSMTLLLQLRLGLPWSFRVGPGTDSERGHLREMLADLPADSLLVADAGFIGYELCRDLIERRQHFLWRVGGNTHLFTELGYESHVQGSTVYLWPNNYRDQPPLQLRLITIRDAARQPVYLVTSVLDAAALTDREAADIYQQRWGIEVHYRTLKQTLEFFALRSQTPATCYLELTWHILGAWLLQLLNVRAVVQVGCDPRQASAAQTRNAVRRCLRGEPACRRSRRSLCRVLAACRQDNYVRRRSKASRDYPRKKQHQPPGPPHLKLPAPKQLQAAKQLTPLALRI